MMLKSHRINHCAHSMNCCESGALVARSLQGDALSLNLPTQPDIDKMWAEEAERRVGQIDRGDVALIPGEKVFAKYTRRSRASSNLIVVKKTLRRKPI